MPDDGRGRPLHLLWSVPVAAAAAALPWFLASLSLCGISGCSGGGFGVSTSGRWEVVPYLAVSGALLGLAFLVPWHARRRVRLVTAAVVAVAWTVVNAVAMFAQV